MTTEMIELHLQQAKALALSTGQSFLAYLIDMAILEFRSGGRDIPDRQGRTSH